MSDKELDGVSLEQALRDLGVPVAFYSWRHAGNMRYAVIAFEDPDDRYTSKLGDNDSPAEREGWQRANTILGIGPDIHRVMWEAKQSVGTSDRNTVARMGLTLWFDRENSQYHVGPRCQRYGKTGRPAWADEVTGTGSGILLPH